MNSKINQAIKSSKRYLKVQETIQRRKASLDYIKERELQAAYLQGRRDRFKKYTFRTAIFGFIVYFNSDTNSSNKLSYFLSTSLRNFVVDFLNSPRLRITGTEFLDSVFRNELTHKHFVNAYDWLLKQPSVIKETEKFGTELFITLLNNRLVFEHSRKLLEEFMQMEEVKDEAIEITQHVIKRSEAKVLVSGFFIDEFKRQDIIKSMTSLMIQSGVNCLNSARTKNESAKFIADVWSDSSLRWFVLTKILSIWSQDVVTVQNKASSQQV